MSDYLEARAIFEEFGIQVVPANVMPAIGQTRAIATLDRIRNRHGEAHARFVVMTLAETANNKAFIDETSLWVISDMARAAAKNFPYLIDNHVSQWFAFFDALPFGWLQYWVHDLDGIVSKRHALVGMIYERMLRKFGAMAVQGDLLDDRRGAA